MLTLLTLSAALAQAPTSGTERQRAAINRCIGHWGETPFAEDAKFRVLSTSVRIMGLGSQEVVETATAEPELVLVEPSVNVLTKTTFKLRNPNGWYCFDTNVGVLSKIVFDADCGANLVDSRSGAKVAGNSATNGGVIVLGEVEVHRSCKVGEKPQPAPAESPAELPPAEPDKPKSYEP